MWTEKLMTAEKVPSRRSAECFSDTIPAAERFGGTAIGIDASLRGTGIAIVDFSQATPKILFSERIGCGRALSFFQCIAKIFGEMDSILSNFHIDAAAIEQTVYVQNHKIAHILGAAKGAIIAALANKGIAMAEYAPLRIKRAVTGVGRASKEQIRRTVCNILNIDTEISYDECDAIAAALCHAWSGTRGAVCSRSI
jgi:crossover junction endodeoxyribonuclease RuvC